MLTSAMPAVVKALTGVLPPAAVKQLTQALGNCNQEVTQRGDVNVSPDAWTNVNNNNGVYYGDTWNVRNYGDIINNINNDVTTNNQNLFDFSTRQEFTTNNFYGGDTINYAGDVFFDTVTTNNLITNVVTVNNPAGEQGPAGPPGDPGMAGRDGVDGVVNIDDVVLRLTRLLKKEQLEFLKGIELKRRTYLLQVPTAVNFNPETCEVSLQYDPVEIAVVENVLIDPGNARVFVP